MLHRSADFRFALQSLEKLGGVAFVVELLSDLNGLQGDAPPDPPIAGQVDHPHGATAEDCLDFVFTVLGTLGGGRFGHLKVQ